jgi:hypothetical protein
VLGICRIIWILSLQRDLGRHMLHLLVVLGRGATRAMRKLGIDVLAGAHRAGLLTGGEYLDIAIEVETSKFDTYWELGHDRVELGGSKEVAIPEVLDFRPHGVDRLVELCFVHFEYYFAFTACRDRI